MGISILELMQQRTVLFDGAMGSVLIEKGLKAGECPEGWNLTHPEVIAGIHRAYFEAGADIVLTNTFGGNRIKLTSYGLAERVEEINRQGAQVARSAIPEDSSQPRFIAGDIGPTGQFLQPLGSYTEEEFRELFAQQAAALVSGGVDLLCLETMYDAEEVKAALRGAIDGAGGRPVFATMTFQRSRKGFFTMMGLEAAAAMRLLEENGAQAVGANCSTGAEDMAELVRILRGATVLPLIAQPNAGSPVIEEGKARYLQRPEEFGRAVLGLIEAGASAVGGCCGTNPEFIRALAAQLRERR
ncbi:MAG: homocysteine S-methyltransferase family protein [Candidatus Tectomicrobia bacterium]|uniref:Homocysteine S-methyltransferase family protein n=1 Tax=Tectimicrobiota bacterium TaxID=2528274 RepID=A0A932CML3_UNCTE|nr:homocysteine S-methyltransferase family protein [Candidatus Tectomicrobia bacterium]